MAVRMKDLLDRFATMQKAAQDTLAAKPGALVGVENLPGSEHDAPVPAEAKEPNKEVAQGQPSGAASTEGAVNGGDAKPLNEQKLEVDQPLVNPVQKPAIDDNALTAKEAEARLGKIVGELLADIKGGQQKQAQDNGGKEPSNAEPKKEAGKDGGEKTATAQDPAQAPQKIVLDDDTLSKIAAAMATFNAGRKAAEDVIKAAEAKTAKDNGAQAATEKTDAEKQAAEKQAAEKQAAEKKSAALAVIKEACIKAAQESGLDPAAAAAAADNAMAAAGMDVAPAAATAGSETPAGEGAGDVQIPEDVSEEELAAAIIDCVQSGEIDADTAKALVDEIAGDAGDGAGEITEDQAAEIIANGLESGEITPDQAKELVAAIESGEGASAGADAAGAEAEAQGAADAAAAAESAAAEAKGAADTENAIKAAAAEIRADAIQKVAAAITSKREQVKQAAAKQGSTQKDSPLLQKVASILKTRQEAHAAKAQAEKKASPEEEKYLAGFKKKAEELGVDPQALAKYICSRQAK